MHLPAPSAEESCLRMLIPLGAGLDPEASEPLEIMKPTCEALALAREGPPPILAGQIGFLPESMEVGGEDS
jgi:hypothetical protein